MAFNNKNDKNPEAEYEEVAIAIPISPSTNEQSIQMDTKNLQKVSCPSPEISVSSPRPNGKPLKYPSSESPLTRRTNTFKGRPKSRFGEPSVPIDSEIIEKLGSHRFESQTPHSDCGLSAVDATPRAKKEEEKEKRSPDEYEIYKRVTAQLSARNFRKTTLKLVLELLVFSVILGLLICSLIVDGLKGKKPHGVESWKWFLLLMVIFSGLLLTHWIVLFFVFVIEWKFLLRKNVVYFTHGLKDNAKVFIWLGVVLCTWVVLFRPHINRTPKSKKIIDFLTWTLVSLFIGSFLWLVKSTLIKLLASSFQFNRFFDRIQESVFHHYVLQLLSGRPLVELARKISKEDSHVGQVSFTEHTGTDKAKKVVDWGKLHQMKKEKVPFWTMHLLADVISNSGLTTMSGLLEKDVVEGDVELDNDEITSEEEAIATAVRIFYNVVQDKDDTSYMDRSDLLRFMIMEEVDLVYPLFEVDEKRHISLKAFSKWVVKIYKDRQALQHALNDNKTAVKQFNQLLTGILIVLIIILWLLITEIATTKIVLFFSSQLVVAAFIFGNTCKTIFEAIIFVFVMHPFDVGDRCIIDGTMLVVEQMNILTTVFLKIDKEKVYYPNSVLATKAIGNYYRSPDQGDSLEFAIDYTTPMSTIAKLKDRIKQYLEQNQSLWQLDHSLVVKEIENMNKIKVALFFNHTMNFQDFAEKTRRRSELVLQMKTIFDDLQIKYHLLPLEIHLRNLTTNCSSFNL
ncbi:hypothetical protein Cgig2_016284 [Carnegiea gigantea]|uniref:Mechanosensitive ion channel protein n=1 Tax=Carnegiea gigantea TaxID=171969 RepID=A0A9Q1KH94_9CARY|nr:hypothetical protein Cgig2_016284 [Carnegiea gigantea]